VAGHQRDVGVLHLSCTALAAQLRHGFGETGQVAQVVRR
jgi:hypothetical protein